MSKNVLGSIARSEAPLTLLKHELMNPAAFYRVRVADCCVLHSAANVFRKLEATTVKQIGCPDGDRRVLLFEVPLRPRSHAQ